MLFPDNSDDDDFIPKRISNSKQEFISNGLFVHWKRQKMVSLFFVFVLLLADLSEALDADRRNQNMFIVKRDKRLLLPFHGERFFSCSSLTSFLPKNEQKWSFLKVFPNTQKARKQVYSKRWLLYNLWTKVCSFKTSWFYVHKFTASFKWLQWLGTSCKQIRSSAYIHCTHYVRLNVENYFFVDRILISHLYYLKKERLLPACGPHTPVR
jgi:hypothetical protein